MMDLKNYEPAPAGLCTHDMPACFDAHKEYWCAFIDVDDCHGAYPMCSMRSIIWLHKDEAKRVRI